MGKRPNDNEGSPTKGSWVRPLRARPTALTLAEKNNMTTPKQAILAIIAACVIATLAYLMGLSNGRRDEATRWRLLCQMYGDTHRQSWQRILADDAMLTNAVTFYGSVTGGADDIRIISLALEDYLRNPSIPPETMLDRYRQELK